MNSKLMPLRLPRPCAALVAIAAALLAWSAAGPVRAVAPIGSEPTNPDPGAAPNLTSVTLRQVGPGGSVYDPVSNMPGGRNIVQMEPDRTGMISLKFTATFAFGATGTDPAQLYVTDRDGTVIASPTFSSGVTQNISIPRAEYSTPYQMWLEYAGNPVWFKTIVTGVNSIPSFVPPGGIGGSKGPGPTASMWGMMNVTPHEWMILIPTDSGGKDGGSGEANSGKGTNTCCSGAAGGCTVCSISGDPTHFSLSFNGTSSTGSEDSGGGAPPSPGGGAPGGGGSGSGGTGGTGGGGWTIGDAPRAEAMLPAGTSYQGTSATQLRFKGLFRSFITLDEFSVEGNGDAIITRTTGSSPSLTIQTASAYTDVETISATKITVKFSTDPSSPSTSVVRTTDFEKDSTGNLITITTHHDSKDIQTRFLSKDPSTLALTANPYSYWIQITEGCDGSGNNGLRMTDLKYQIYPGSTKIVEKNIYERAAGSTSGDPTIPVSSTTTTYNWFFYAWHQVSENNSGLVSTWNYYNLGSDPAAAKGQIHLVSYPDGLSIANTYVASGSVSNHATITSFGAGDTTTENRIHNAAAGTLHCYTTVDHAGVSNTISDWMDAWSDIGAITERVHTDYPASGSTIVTTTDYVKFGTADYGGHEKKVTRPDGTISLTTYSPSTATSGGSLTAVIRDGAPKSDHSDVIYGTSTELTVNEDGVLDHRMVTAIDSGGPADGMTLEEVDVTSFFEDKPETYTYFAGATGHDTWQMKVDYGCCGVYQVTDRHGVDTYYDYDSLQRETRRNTLGVTVATVYDGISIKTYRYPEAYTGGHAVFAAIPGGSQTGSYTRDVADTTRTIQSISPATGGLITSSVTAVTYQNPNGSTPASLGTNIGKKVVTSLVHVADDGGSAQPTQTAEYYAGGQLFRSYGDISPGEKEEYSSDSVGLSTTRYAVGADGVTTHESAKIRYDQAGRTYSTYSDAKGTTAYAYNLSSQLTSLTDGDGKKTLFEYNSRGQRYRTILDVNGNGVADYGSDEAYGEELTYALHGGIPVIRMKKTAWKTGGAEVTLSYKDVTANGLKSWETTLPGTTGVARETSSYETYVGSGSWNETFVAANGQTTRDYYTGGLLLNRSRWLTETFASFYAPGFGPSSPAGLAESDAYFYDSAMPLRIASTINLRTGATSYSYLNAVCDNVVSMTQPAAYGSSTSPRVTSYTYDDRGRTKVVKLPGWSSGAASVYEQDYSYYMNGLLKDSNGGQIYHTFYTYDYANRMATLSTYGSVSPAVTTWAYDGAGRLHSKTDAQSHAVTYGYTTGGRLRTRTWARGRTTLYGYDGASRLVVVGYYLDATLTTTDPDTLRLNYYYDSLGRITEVDRNGAQHFIYTYDSDKLTLATERQMDVPATFQTYFPRLLTRKTDGLLRSTGYLFGSPSDADAISEVSYDYSDSGRLHSITYQATPGASPLPSAQVFTYGYGYSDSSGLDSSSTTGVKTSFMPFALNGGGPGASVYKTTRTYESSRNVLHAVTNTVAGSAFSSTTFDAVDDLGRRIDITRAGAGGSEHWENYYDAKGQIYASAPSVHPSDYRMYNYDGIGNRTSVISGTAPSSATTNYYGSTTPGGSTYASGGNAINQYNKINDGSDKFPTYDLDGNQTSNGSGWTYIWDGENRLIEASQPATVAGNRKIDYSYDYKGRLYLRTEYIWQSSGAYNAGERYCYTYDGWNRIDSQVDWSWLRDEYVWGLDLSGTRRGAGGVGGLLMWKGTLDAYTSGTENYLYYPLYDGNGNVTDLTDASGTSIAHWDYDPFGNIERSTSTPFGTMDPKTYFEFKFSTKAQDRTTGLVYYGYRWYNSVTGRWISRDKINEKGGYNLYGLCSNDSLDKTDILGLDPVIVPNINSDGQPVMDVFDRPSSICGWLSSALFTGKTEYKSSYKPSDEQLENNFENVDGSWRVLPDDARGNRAKKSQMAHIAPKMKEIEPLLTDIEYGACIAMALPVAVEGALVAAGSMEGGGAAAAAGESRAFWAGQKALDFAVKTGANIYQPSEAALLAADAGDWSLIISESAEWAAGTSGEATVIIDTEAVAQGAGKILFGTELPILQELENAGTLVIRYLHLY